MNQPNATDKTTWMLRMLIYGLLAVVVLSAAGIVLCLMLLPYLS
jgi:hypothetical protein